MEDTAEVSRLQLCSWKEGGCVARMIPVCSSHTISWSLQSQRFGPKAPGVISNPTVHAASLNCSCFSMSLAAEQGGGDITLMGLGQILLLLLTFNSHMLSLTEAAFCLSLK